MKSRKVPNHCLVAVVFLFATWQISPHLIAPASADGKATARPIVPLDTIDEAKDTHRASNKLCSTKPNNRAESVRAVVSHLGLGEGSVVADIGAGSGRDTWIFAKIVGEKGTVFA